MDTELPIEPKNKLLKQVAAIVSATFVIIFSTGMFYGDTKRTLNDQEKTIADHNVRITKIEDKYTNIAITQAITPEQIKTVINSITLLNGRMDRQDTVIKDDQRHINVIMDILLDDYKRRTGKEYIPKK